MDDVLAELMDAKARLTRAELAFEKQQNRKLSRLFSEMHARALKAEAELRRVRETGA